MSLEVQITIIGGGVIGCAVAYELSRDSGKDIVVVEKNRQIKGENQSSRNSGVIHAGIYYPKKVGPLKAKLCVEGNEMLYRFCAENNIPHKKTGKLLVATDLLEEEYLEDVYRTAVENQVPGIEMIDGNKVAQYEPNVKAVSALFVPTSGIIESTSLVDKLYRLAESYGAMFLVGNEVFEVEPEVEGFKVKIRSGTEVEIFKTRIIVNAAGLYSDDIVRLVNPESPYRMDSFKGEWGKFYKTKRENIYMNGLNVYPVPFGYLPDGEKLKLPFREFQEKFSKGEINKSVGVHLSPTFETRGNEYIVGDTVIVGPAYSKPENREDYIQTRGKKYYLNMVKPFFPGLELEDISLHQTGIRAKLKDYYDFIIEKDPKYPNLINLVGIDSPGLTASLAIARYVGELLGR
ncbi:MAG: FAD-dependent oxidoreductase [Actinomycetia bacterium]|nr:FAD-dependent oxidoreductase [Actinomycetota bacterium]MCG2791434.1 FAD-dependent oxidoreductase [Actinomycetes bacterium]